VDEGGLGRQILIAVAPHGLSPYLGIKNEVFFFSLLDFSMVLDSAQISGCYQPMSKSGLALEEEKTQSDVPEYPGRADKPDQNFKA